MEKTSIFDRVNSWARKSVTLKLIAVGFLILILMIPASMMRSLIRERQQTRDGAIKEVSSKWGGFQTIGGPIISVPYQALENNNAGKAEYVTKYAHFLPDNLKISGDLKPEKRYRGIYVVMLYNGKINISGSFKTLNFAPLNIPEKDLNIEQAFISVGITDMKGIKDNVNIKLNDSTLQMEPGIPTSDIFVSGLSVPIKLDVNGNYTFSFDLNVNGSSFLHFLPFGKETNVELKSAWGDPKFEGAFLPDERTITNNSFTAKWKILHLNRNYPQQGVGEFIEKNNEDKSNNYYVDNDDNDQVVDGGKASSFGVRLILPVDEYKKTMRSVNYNIMFIFITFLAFFFMEIINKRRIHPLQYLLIGFAICLFYILLLSISEYIKFDMSYLWSCVAILSLITFYTKSIFKSNKLTILMTSILAILYGFFYSILQLQDYALLMGSLGLLVILAVVMYLTRNINWYNISNTNSNQLEEHN